GFDERERREGTDQRRRHGGGTPAQRSDRHRAQRIANSGAIMTKKGKDKGNPNPPIALRDVLAGKPELVVHGGDLTTSARALAKLLAEKCDYLFVHGGKPVIVELGEDDAPPSMRPAGVNEIIIAAHKLCQPIRYKDGERLEVTLLDKVAELYLAMPEDWRLRPLVSFANSPMLRDDGTIHCENGYDA